MHTATHVQHVCVCSAGNRITYLLGRTQTGSLLCFTLPTTSNFNGSLTRKPTQLTKT